MPNEILNTRSSEVNEILGKPPKAIIRWGISLIFIIILFILVGSYFIEYPLVFETTAKISFKKNETNTILTKNTNSDLTLYLLLNKNLSNIQKIKENQAIIIQLINKNEENYFYKGLIKEIDISSENIKLSIKLENNITEVDSKSNEGLITPITIVLDNKSILVRILSKLLRQ